jgi:3-oxoadipate enol-lactonase
VSVEVVSSFDGTLLAARMQGDGDRVPVLFVNAIGASFESSAPLADRLRGRRTITWDLRGLHDSDRPRSERIDPPAHAEDAVAVLDALESQTAFVAAWSTGTRIGIEIARSHPDRVAGLVLVCGAYGHSPLRLRHLEVASAMPTLAGIARHFSGVAGGLIRAVTERPELPGLIRHSGLVAAEADVDAVADVMRAAARCDPRMLLAVYSAVVGDAARDALPEIVHPALIVAGGRDQFTSLELMGETAIAIPGGRLLVYDEASHFLPLEFPDRLADDIAEFFAEAEPGSDL